MRLREWAEREGVHYQTAWRWVRDGQMPVPVSKTPTGMIMVHVDEPAAGGVGLYARVSSHDQRGDLDRQIVRLTSWAAEQQLPVVRVEAEVGSGMNGQRRKVRRLLADAQVTTVVVEHRDRLGRMNVELVEAALSAHGRRLVVIDDGEVDDDLVRDMVEVLTSFCARLYGQRGARNRAQRALTCAKNADA